MNVNKLVTAMLCSTVLANQAPACSAFFVPVHTKNSNYISNVLGFRSLDFEEDLPTQAVYGEVGDANTSSIDVSLYAWDRAVSWNNNYRFIGKLMSANQLMDGINSAGLYMGGLYLPNVTVYPESKAASNQPTLSVFDLINYVLGTSGSVAEAINKIGMVEVDLGTIQQNSGRKVYPLHFIIIDKKGNSAVIEFTGGVMKITTTGNLQVMTNSPEIAFQQINYDELAKTFSNNNTNYQVDGQYMNGSGYLGLPGDSMPPSRYARLRALLTASPTAYSEAQATYVVNSVSYAGAIVPIGINPAPTFWSSFFNLNTGDYTIRNYITGGLNNTFAVTPENAPYYLQRYNVNNIDVSNLKHVTISYVESRSVIMYQKAKDLMAAGTSPTTSYAGAFADAP